MSPEQKPAEGAAPPDEQGAPADALGKSNEELGVQTTTPTPAPTDTTPLAKQPGKIKRLFRKINLYLLLFLLVVVIAGAVSVVSYLNSKKTPKTPTIATQPLTTETLKQLANSDATVGDSGQTLTVQGNAIFSGQVLMKSDLNVAGTIKVGSSVVVPSITVSGKSTLSDTQVNSLQVANNSVFQGSITAQKDLNVAGAAAFSGPLTAGQITVSKLIMSGTATLEVPNHVSFTGASPGRTINVGVLGAGGTASVSGSDTTGTININTGSSPTPGCFTDITFNKQFNATPHVILTPINSGAGLSQYYVTRNAKGFSVCANATPPANQVFAFDYFITQ